MLFNSYIDVTLRYIFTAFNRTQTSPNHEVAPMWVSSAIDWAKSLETDNVS